MSIVRGLEFEDQANQPRRPRGATAQLEGESGWLLLRQRCGRLAQVLQERFAYVVGLSDVDPVSRIRESVDPGLVRGVLAHRSRRERSRRDRVKRHWVPGVP